MAKTLSSTAAAAGGTPVTAASTSQTPTTQEENDSAEGKALEAKVTELEEANEVKTSSDPNVVELNARYRFLNPTKWTIRCPYSKEVFPAEQVTPKKVTVNQWIRSQVKAGILRVQVD